MRNSIFRKNNDDNWNETYSEETFTDDELNSAMMDNVVNRKNKEEFQNIMDNASRNLDGYWDKNNIFIKLITYIIWTFAILGVLYYLVLWFSNK